MLEAGAFGLWGINDMGLVCGNSYFIDGDDWSELRSFMVVSQSEDYISVFDIDGNAQELPREVLPSLRLHPISYDRSSKKFKAYKFVQDVASSLIRQYEQVGICELIEKISGHDRIEISDEGLVFLLKSLVANESFAVKSVGRGKANQIFLTLGDQRKEIEKRRVFAASIASELDALSSRIRLIVSHSGTVGTYRESLLQNVLRKHLPERYHVATGFIYGCPRQIDILIYDRLDYAPLFREGDLVVVPPNSVRAVIEVKTSLTADELRKSLKLLSAVAMHDDCSPPIFKGIFSFESVLTKSSLCKIIAEYYIPDRFSEDCSADEIMQPFSHFTCVCVLEKHYVYTLYEKSLKGMMIPGLYSRRSHTNLKSQVAFFMQSLLAHLRFGGMKNNNLYYMDAMLGGDTISEYHGDLVDGRWGPYFLRPKVRRMPLRM